MAVRSRPARAHPTPSFLPRPFRPRRHLALYRPRRATRPGNRCRGRPFLLQAQFSVSEADITALKSGGVLAWLDARYAEPLGQTGVAWLDSHGHDAITAEKRYRLRQPGDYMIWNQLIAGPDQMRKRIALALSELFVVSLTAINFLHPAYVIAAYWDVLTANAFGNFRKLLEALTLNAGDGFLSQYQGQSQGKLERPPAG